MANAIFYSNFTVFLNTDVVRTFSELHIKAITILILDPISSIVLGYIIYVAYKKHSMKSSGMLNLALFLLSLAFSILVLALTITHNNDKIAILWPIIMIIFFTGAEFLIQTTVNAQVNHLVSNTNRQGFFMGTLQTTRALSATSAFYLIQKNLPATNSSLQMLPTENMHLYANMSLIALLSCSIFFILNKTKLIRV